MSQIPEEIRKAYQIFSERFNVDQFFVRIGGYWLSREYIYSIRFINRYNDTQKLLLIAVIKDLDLQSYTVKLKMKGKKIYLIVSHNKKPVHTEEVYINV